MAVLHLFQLSRLLSHMLQIKVTTIERANLKNSQLVLALLLLIGVPLSLVGGGYLWRQIQLRPTAQLTAEAEAAEWLKQSSPETAVVVGSSRLGRLSERTTLVFEGDTLPESLNNYLLNPPDYFVTYQTLDWRYVTSTNWFEERYAIVKQVGIPNSSESPLTIWQKQPGRLVDTPSTAIDVTSEDGLDLVSYSVSSRRIKPGDGIHVQLDWRVSRPPTETVQTIVRLVSPHDQVAWAQRDMPTPRSLPSDWLQTGMVVPERFVLTTTLEIPVGAYLLTTSLHDPNANNEDGYSVMFQDGDPNPLDRASLGYVVVPWQGEIPESAVEIDGTYGDQVRLISCDCPSNGVAGEELNLTLFWEGVRPPDDNYVVFVHLLDGAAQFVTGADAPPFGGRYEMRAWRPGDIVPDERVLRLPADLPAGEYGLQVGLYQRESGVRLSAVDGDGVELSSQAIRLPNVEIGGR